MPRVSETVSSGVKARIDSARKLIDTEIRTIRDAADELLSLKPVAAVLDLTNKTGTAVVVFVKDQAEITRRAAR